MPQGDKDKFPMQNWLQKLPETKSAMEGTISQRIESFLEIIYYKP